MLFTKDWYAHARRSRFRPRCVRHASRSGGHEGSGPQFVEQRLFDNFVGQQNGSTRTVLNNQRMVRGRCRSIKMVCHRHYNRRCTDIIIVPDLRLRRRALTTSKRPISMSSDLWRSSFCRFIAGPSILLSRRAVDDASRGAEKLSSTICSFSAADHRRRRPVSSTTATG